MKQNEHTNSNNPLVDENPNLEEATQHNKGT